MSDCLNEALELRENPQQFGKNPSMKDALQLCNEIKDVKLGKKHRNFVTVIHFVQKNPAFFIC